MHEIPICSVCLDLKVSDLCALRCGHVFHTACAFQALECKPQCPECKAKTTANQTVLLFFQIDIDTTAPTSIKLEDTDIQKIQKTKIVQLQNQLDQANQFLSNERQIKKRENDEMLSKCTQLQISVTSLKAQYDTDMEQAKKEITKLKLDKAALQTELKKKKENEIKENQMIILAQFMDAIENDNDNTQEFVTNLKSAFSPIKQLRAATTMFEWSKQVLTKRIHSLQIENEELQRKLLKETENYNEIFSKSKILKQKKVVPEISEKSTENEIDYEEIQQPNKKKKIEMELEAEVKEEEAVKTSQTDIYDSWDKSKEEFEISSTSIHQNHSTKTPKKKFKSTSFDQGKFISRGFDGMGGTKLVFNRSNV